VGHKPGTHKREFCVLVDCRVNEIPEENIFIDVFIVIHFREMK
jgi:hypothetical protein